MDGLHTNTIGRYLAEFDSGTSKRGMRGIQEEGERHWFLAFFKPQIKFQDTQGREIYLNKRSAKKFLERNIQFLPPNSIKEGSTADKVKQFIALKLLKQSPQDQSNSQDNLIGSSAGGQQPAEKVAQGGVEVPPNPRQVSSGQNISEQRVLQNQSNSQGILIERSANQQQLAAAVEQKQVEERAEQKKPGGQDQVSSGQKASETKESSLEILIKQLSPENQKQFQVLRNKLSEEERSSLAPILEQIQTGNPLEILFVLEGVKKKKDLCDASHLLMKGITDAKDCCEILKFAHSIPSEKRKAFCGEVASVSSQIPDINKRLSVLKSIRIDEAEAFTKAVEPIVRGIVGDPTEMLLFFADEKVEKKAVLCNAAKLLMEGVTTAKECCDLLRFARTIPSEERQNFCEAAQPFLQGISGGADRFKVLHFVKEEISAGDRESLSKQLAPILQNLENINERLNILKFCQENIKILPNLLPILKEAKEPGGLCQAAALLMEGVTDLEGRSRLFEIASKIPLSDRLALCESVSKRLKGITNPDRRLELVKFNLKHTQKYPNYFGIKTEAEQIAAQKQLGACFTSILNRLNLPYKNQNGDIVRGGFFQELNERVQKQAPGAKVYISGGICRGLLGYIYAEIHHAHQEKGLTSVDKELVEQVLKEIAEGEKPLLSSAVIGAGVSLDFSIEFPDYANSATKSAILQDANQFINSAGESIKNNKLRKIIAPEGTFREYNEQIGIATRQGGSSLDYLAFPVANGSKAKEQDHDFRMPAKHQDILQNFFNGEVEFREPPKNIQGVESATMAVVSGLRPLLEIPFLQMKSGGIESLRGRIRQIPEPDELDRKVEAFVRGQFAEMVASQRFQAANRFAQFSINEEDIASSVRSLSQKYATKEEKGTKMPLIPEFTGVVKMDARTEDYDPGNLRGAKLLMETADFIENCTDKGKLYHGTPRVEHMLGMLRGGMVTSSSEQGRAIFGKGTYTTPQRDEASNYADGTGAVLELSVKTKGLRVFNYDQLSKTQEGQKKLGFLTEKARRAGMDLNEYLAKTCAVDIIVRTHVILQNADAVQIPRNIQEMAQTAYANFKSSLKECQTEEDLVKVKNAFLKNYTLFNNLGVQGLPSPVSIDGLVRNELARIRTPKK